MKVLKQFGCNPENTYLEKFQKQQTALYQGMSGQEMSSLKIQFNK